MGANFWQTYFVLNPIHHRSFGTKRKLDDLNKIG